MHAQIVLFDGFDPLTVELITAEGPREVVSASGGPALRAHGSP